MLLAGMVFVARACWPGEGVDEPTSLLGIGWVAVALGAMLLAIVGMWNTAWPRRMTWVDGLALGLIVLVGMSAGHAADRRIAINLAWQWAGVGMVYFLFRVVPRGEPERRALVIVLIATGVALACYGLYQVAALYPEARRLYRENPLEALRAAGVATDPISRQGFEHRLLSSQEPISTFSLANSLGGFLLPPLVMLLGAGVCAISRRGAGMWKSVASIVALALPIGVCFLLTKSRTAYVGLLLGVALLVALQGKALRARTWLVAAVLVVAALTALVLAGLATRQLDRLVLTESFKSLRYRWEYWVGAWRILWDGSTWVSGLGPGNFAGPYLRHKLEVASEGIKDPHNAFLEVWTTAGIVGLAVFAAACGGAIFRLGTAARGVSANEEAAWRHGDALPDRWLIYGMGVGGLVLAMILRPDLSPFARSLNPFEGDFDRWVVLGLAWVSAAWVLQRVRLGEGTTRAALLAGFCAMLVNFLGAGGIGFAPVAAMFWCPLALGLSRAQAAGGGEVGTRGPLWRWLAPVIVWAAVVGVFVGTIGPAWQAEAEIRAGEAAQDLARRSLQRARTGGTSRVSAELETRGLNAYEWAARSFQKATQADRLSSRPWMLWSLVELEAWDARGRPIPDFIWHRLKSQLRQARTPPRDPKSFVIASMEYQVANRLLGIAGWPPVERKALLEDRLSAARLAAVLNPTSAGVQADLAYAAEDSGELRLAIEAATRALHLDAITPHKDRKLPPGERARLEESRERWEAGG